VGWSAERVRLEREDIEAIAERVLELLRNELEQPARLVDASALAAALSVDRTWVYAHADELHAVRLGGEHGRLRFDLDQVVRSLNGNGDAPEPRVRKTRRATAMRAGGELLPIDP
jgi:hypothetical protein